MTARSRAAVPAVVLLSLAAPVAAAPGVQEPDSAGVVEGAHAEQGRFERDRVRVLPPDRGGFGGECEETVGRMCVRLRETSDWWPEPDPPELAQARDALVETLAAAREAAPADDWILGQLVVYLGEAGRWDEALGVARRCGEVDRWWCQALAGLALHRLGRYVDAEEIFRSALEEMPPEQRGRWTDVEPLLGPEGAKAREERLSDSGGRELAAAEVPHLDERWWRLADPLLLVEGNDRLTEHWARHTVSRTRVGARNPYATSWGWDMEELLVRYGIEVGWARQLPASGSIGVATAAVGHHHPYSRGFLPPPEAWTDPAATGPDAWNPGSRRTPAAVYAPEYAPVFLPVAAQISASRRGDSVVVRAGWNVPEDTTWHGEHGHDRLPPPRALEGAAPVRGLFLLPVGRDGASPDDTVHRVVARDTAGGALSLGVPTGDWVVSLEVWDPGRGLAGRHREGLRLPPVPIDVPTLSDLLVARPAGELPDAPEPFLATVGSPPVPAPGGRIRVGWEVSGLGWHGPEELAYRLELRESQGGLATRVGRWLRLVGDPEGVGLRWREAGPGRPTTVFRAVDLDLPSSLPEGRYTLRLTLLTQGRSPLVTERALDLRLPR